MFVSCTLVFLVIAYFYFEETRHKTLEEIASAFGDRVVTLTERDLTVEESEFESKAGPAGRIEVAKTAEDSHL